MVAPGEKAQWRRGGAMAAASCHDSQREGNQADKQRGRKHHEPASRALNLTGKRRPTYEDGVPPARGKLGARVRRPLGEGFQMTD